MKLWKKLALVAAMVGASAVQAQDINVGVVVDTHVGRLAVRLGLTRETAPEKVEQALMKLVPQAQWAMLSHWLIWHGRRRCGALRRSGMSPRPTGARPSAAPSPWR